MEESARATSGIVKELRENGEDYEFYPTTQEIVDGFVRYMEKFHDGFGGSILDIGCGNGSFFRKLDIAFSKVERYSGLYHGERFGIEKSMTLAMQLPDNVFLLGTDFHQQTLIDKPVGTIFCNPPYSEYEHWMARIIKEGNAKQMAFVVPERWKNSDAIKFSLERRQMVAKTLGTYDFANAERKARCTVDLVFVEAKERHYGEKPTDPFDLWFEDTFKINADKAQESDWRQCDRKREAIRHEIVEGENVADRLLSLYQKDMENLLNTYRTIEKIDCEVFRELKIDLEGVKKALKEKVAGLKSAYWKELFENYDRLTNKLTSDSVEKITGKLNNNLEIDFTAENIFQITLWVVRHSNKLYEEQLKNFFMKLIRPENIARYKSNRHWNDDSWRFAKEEFAKAERWDKSDVIKKMSHHVALEYRIVCEGFSNFSSLGFNSCKLENEACVFLHDVCKIAKSLGFPVREDILPTFSWDSDRYNINWKNFDIPYANGKVFANVKLYQNGNRHFKFDKEFMKKLNVEAGRLFGWIRDKKEAAEDLGLSAAEVEAAWGCNHQIRLGTATSLLGLPPPPQES